jgi:hypothetical protein
MFAVVTVLISPFDPTFHDWGGTLLLASIGNTPDLGKLKLALHLFLKATDALMKFSV